MTARRPKEECSDSKATQVGLAALVGLGGFVWSLTSAYDTARDRNRDLREQFGITTDFAVRPVQRDRVEFALSVRFR